MEIKYSNKIVLEPIFLTTAETQIKPVVSLKGLDDNKYYTLIMSDPDAVGGNRIHWIVTHIKGNHFNKGNHFFEYYGPHPPKNSGKHRYIFSLYESGKDNMKDVDLDPTERQIELEHVLQELNITGNPIYTTHFISENQDGGKRKRNYTKKRKNKRKRSYKRRKY
jgi:large subunit ribosomal protein L35